MSVVLWDIDGTLLRGKGGRVSINAFIRALQQTSRLEAELVYPDTVAGMTDRGIALDVLAVAAVAEAEASRVLGDFCAAYAAELERDRQRLVEDMLVLPGVPEVLAQLSQLGVVQSLLTGNLEPIARLKLGLVELDQYVDFALGAFGSDHHDRNCLVPIVRARLEQRFGSAPRLDEIVVVGDTPRDIACARAGGVRVVAVATGTSSRAELEAHQPDAVLDDLRATDRVVATLLQYSSSAQPDSRALIV